STRFMSGLLSFFDEIAVEGELADEWVHLAQAHRHRRTALQVAAEEAVGGNTQLQSRERRVVHGCGPVLLGEGGHAQYSSHSLRSVRAVDLLAQRADVRPGEVGAAQERLSALRCAPWLVPLLDPVAAAACAQVLPQETAGGRMQEAHMEAVPLHLHLA